MECPTCHEPMTKIAWRITNNAKDSADYKEYDTTMYECKTDDVWIETTIPIAEKDK